MKYRKLYKYKYQIMNDETYNLNSKFKFTDNRVVIETDWIKLTNKGIITIRKGYCYDGPSGPTIDTPTFMRGSLIHDALYQLIRIKLLDMKYRETADNALKNICIEDGMNSIRAWYVKLGVRMFGGKLLKHDLGKPQDIIYEAP